jgi:hypothetical protein
MSGFAVKSHAFCYNVAKMKLILDSKDGLLFAVLGWKVAHVVVGVRITSLYQVAMGKHEVNEPHNDYDASERFKTTCLLLRF